MKRISKAALLAVLVGAFFCTAACAGPTEEPIRNVEYSVEPAAASRPWEDPNVENVEPVETEETLYPEEEGKNILHISTYGDDAAADGTFEKPFASFDAAKAYINANKSAMDGDIVVYVRGGTYFSRDSLDFTQADNYDGGTITYKAYPGHHPSLSGGTVIESEWVEADGLDGIWKTSLADIDPVEDVHGNKYDHTDKLYVREFYANNKWQKRSTTEDWLNEGKPTSSVFYDKDAADGKRDGIMIRQEINEALPDGVFDRNDDGTLKNKYMEASFVTTWRNYRIAVTNAEKYVDEMERNYFRFEFDARYFQALTQMTPMDQALTPSNAFTIENALCLVDTETEFYYDVDTQELYWMPEAGVDPNEAYCVIPTSECLMNFNGASPEDRVENIGFEGITFENSTMLDVSLSAYYGYQSIFLVEPYKRETGAINMNYASGISFENCTFRNLSSSAFCLYDSNRDILFDGNLFYDIGGSGINYGYNDQLMDVTQPQSEENDLKVNADITITNNLFTRTEIEYWGLCAIQGIYGNDITISHNEFDDLYAYSVAIGWGWYDGNRYEMRNLNVTHNKFTNIQQIMHDGAAVYTMGTVIDSHVSYNYVDDVNLGYGALYCDEGSKDWIVEHNVIVNCDKAFHFWVNTIRNLTVRDNYANTQDGTYNQAESCYVELPYLIEADALPPAALAIKNEAGLEKDYTELRQRANNWAYGLA